MKLIRRLSREQSEKEALCGRVQKLEDVVRELYLINLHFSKVIDHVLDEKERAELDVFGYSEHVTGLKIYIERQEAKIRTLEKRIAKQKEIINERSV